MINNDLFAIVDVWEGNINISLLIALYFLQIGFFKCYYTWNAFHLMASQDASIYIYIYICIGIYIIIITKIGNKRMRRKGEDLAVVTYLFVCFYT